MLAIERLANTSMRKRAENDRQILGQLLISVVELRTQAGQRRFSTSSFDEALSDLEEVIVSRGGAQDLLAILDRMRRIV